MKIYLEALANKYPKIFETEKLSQIVRHNSTESMNSVNSLYSQRSFQSASDADTSLVKKKRNWLRSSFIKAFNRNKSSHSNHSSNSNSSTTPPKKSNNNSDAEYDAISKRYSDIDENFKFIGTYSLPNSPIHQQSFNNSNSNQNITING